jgi:hypothetical protein
MSVLRATVRSLPDRHLPPETQEVAVRRIRIALRRIVTRLRPEPEWVRTLREKARL